MREDITVVGRNNGVVVTKYLTFNCIENYEMKTKNVRN